MYAYGLLNQVYLVSSWLLRIASAQMSVCVCVCVCVSPEAMNN